MPKNDDTNNNELSLEAGIDKVSINAKGVAASRIGNALADILSPISESFGLAGDYIKHLRIAREESLLVAMERAKVLRAGTEREGAPVSQKFFIPWVEGASSEDPEENISELWARILASAPENYDAKYSRYVNICKNIGVSEAEFFINVMKSTANTLSKSPFLAGYGERAAISLENRAEFLRDFRNILDQSGNKLDKINETVTKYWQFYENNEYIYNCHILLSMHLIKEDGESVGMVENTSSQMRVGILEGVGLMRRARFTLRLHGITANVEYYEPNELAIEFYKVISNETFPVSAGNESEGANGVDDGE